MAEKAYVRHAWKVLFALALIFALFGAGDLILGASADPQITESVAGRSMDEIERSDPRVGNLINLHVRLGGAWILSGSILTMAISATAFRRGERWAWYVMWATFPLLVALIYAVYFSTELVPGPLPPPMLSAPLFLVLSIVALLLPYRKFFPKS